MKIVVYNLGCKVNKYECDSMMKLLREKGHVVTEELENADIYILNTCAVTNEAERKSRQAVERCLKLNKDAKIYVCGCASEHNAEQFIKKSNVEYVIGSASKMKLCESFENKGVNVIDIPKVYEDDFSPTIDRTRAYVKIQDGCNRFCSYCLIPYVRGRSRSRKIESVIKECEELSKITKEIVITGIDISAFGKDTNETIEQLIERLQSVDCRIRLGSLECSIITDEFLSALAKLKNFCPQFHLSLQSGDNQVLKSMNRHYTQDEYLEKVQLIRKYFEDAAITTDLIVAFPTEDDEKFENTISFIKKVHFAQMHIFPYSKREGTKAAKLNMINGTIVKKRLKVALEVAEKMEEEYIESFKGKTVEVLVEEKQNDYFVGYTKQYIKVKMKNANVHDIKKIVVKTTNKNCIIDE